MSEFLDHITSKLTGRKKSEPIWFQPLSVFHSTEPPPVSTGFLVEHVFQVTYTMTSFYEEGDSGSRDAIMRNFMSQLREAIYGDLREHIISLDKSVHEHDLTGIKNASERIWRLIYDH